MPVRALRKALRVWWAPVLGNLALGVAGLVPLCALWLFAREWPLAALGLTERDPTDNDGMLPWLMILLPLWLVFLLLWFPFNYWMLRRYRLPERRYWAAGTLLTLLPFAITAHAVATS